MKKFIFLSLIIVLAVATYAQPAHFTHNATTGGTSNVFPFSANPAQGKKVQWMITPAGSSGGFSVPSPAPTNHNITTLWFWANSAANANYTNLTVRLANVSTTTFFSVGQFYTGPMTTVHAQNRNLVSPGANNWIAIPLTTPFLYNPSMNLVVEVFHCGYTGSGFSLRQLVFGAAPDRRRQYSDASSACGAVPLPTGGDNAIAGIGISVVPANENCAQNFDAVTAPALPTGWIATENQDVGGNSDPWATTSAVSSSPPNSVTTNDPSNLSDEWLDSRIFAITSTTSQLSFRNSYNLEESSNPGEGFDGMVLEVSIGGGPFVDILTAGGSFVTGGYTHTISSGFSSLISGRQAWSGNSGGFITTTVNLPASANGQNVVFRWRRTTDSSIGGGGAWIDDVTVSGSNCGIGSCLVTCPPNQTTNAAPGQCGAVVNYPAPTTNGACGPVTTSPASGSFFPVGTTTVTASTFAGPSCTFTVTVIDNQPPTITCPANIVRNNDPGVCGAVVTFAATGADNCPGMTFSYSPASGSVFPVGTTTVTATARDASGNTTTCTFTVTVNDTQPPVFGSGSPVPERLYYKFDGTGTSIPNLASAPPPGTATATIVGNLQQGGVGKCGTALIGNGATTPGNHVNTGWAPNLSTPWTISLWLGPNQIDANPSYLFGSLSAGSFRAFYGGAALTNNMLVRGGSGDILITGVNPAATFVTIVYNGTNTVVYKNGGSPQTYAVTFANSGPGPFLVGGYDNAGFTFNGRMDEFGMYSRALSAGEVLALFNACPSTATTCPANITVNNAPGLCAATVTYATPVASDNCPGVNTVQTTGLPSGSSFPVGTTTNTFVATDASGNTATCSFTVTVVDAQAPTITCPANITQTSVLGTCTASVNVPAPTASGDNCGIVTRTWAMTGATTGSSPASGINTVGTQTFNLGVTNITYTVRDAAGNSTSCTFTVTITDAQLPVISVQPQSRNACDKDNVTFSVTANPLGGSVPLTFQWQIWNGTAWVNIPGATGTSLNVGTVSMANNHTNYRVLVSSICSTVTSAVALLNVNPLPTVSITPSTPAPVVHPGESITFTAVVSPGGGTVQWSFNGVPIPGATSLVLPNRTVNHIGTHTVTYTDANGCVQSASIELIGESQPGLFVYPSPTSGIFNVRFFNTAGQQVTLNVYDAKGRRVYSENVTTGSVTYHNMRVNLNTAESGVYFVEVVDAGGSRVGTGHVVISH